ncbi:MAG: hypothetical protein M1814_000665 [Vezdaea aestivalis]|nr:MAG: hypothetical protein M1814_000665 [Vezdaea aestivalis]
MPMSLYPLEALAGTSKDESAIQKWSSVIGIVTAITGNILISFALNIQRYAHLRLRQEQEEHQARTEVKKNGASAYYGTQSQDHDRHENGHELGNDQDDYDESDPLSQSFESARSMESQSIARGKEKENDERYRKSYLQSPYWWLGICLMTVGEAGNFLAYGFAQASIVSPLGVVALISNCLIAPIMLKEKFRQRDFWGVVVAVAGAVIVVLSASSSEAKFGPDQIWDAISRWEFLLYMGITAVLIIGLVWLSRKRYAEEMILIDLGLVGLFGGYTVLATKGISSLLSFTFWRVLTYPVTYLLLAILISTAMLQIKYLNKALQRFNSTEVIPTQFVLFTLSVIIGSAILYRDFKSATADQVGKFVAGCALTFSGVYFITSGRRNGEDSKGAEHRRVADEEADVGIGYERDVETVDENRPLSQGKGSVDNASEAELSAKRRGKRASRSDSHSLPFTPRRYPSDPLDAPSILITSQEGSGPLSFSPTESSPLLNNPWKATDEQPKPQPARPPLGSSISSPSPLLRLPRDQETTPIQSPDQQARLPVTPDRKSTVKRSSISRILPGPLFSPLSSSLSGVVADSLRRGLDVTPISRRGGGGSLRDPRRQALLEGGLRKTKSLRISGDASQFRSERDDDESPSRRALDTPSDFTEPQEQVARRRKSFSTAIGDFFRFRDRRSDESQE